jgi:hypothetical protein
VGSAGSIWLEWLGRIIGLLSHRAAKGDSAENNETPHRSGFHSANHRSSDGTHTTLENYAIFMNNAQSVTSGRSFTVAVQIRG